VARSVARRASWWLVAAVAVGGIVVDQACKALALARLEEGHPLPLLGGLVSLDLVFNSGAAFGMGERITVVFAVAGLLALAGIVVFALPRIAARWQVVAAGLLIAGIGGNLADRLFRPPGPLRGHVVDFISLPYFAVINVADIFITCTAVVIGVRLVFFSAPSPPADAADAAHEPPDAAGSDAAEAAVTSAS